jgi:hypothetical protein
MKTQKKIIFAAALLLLVSSNGWGGEKAKLGPCVRQCVQAFNPSLADSGADEFMAEDFRGRDCVRLCNENLYQGECYPSADACCNPDYLDTDPDCQGEPPPDPPDPPGNGLPPDPGEAGKATLEGIDSDGSQKTRAALRQFTLALNMSILESPDEASALNNTEDIHRASECLWYIHSELSIKMSDLLMSEYLNTINV